MILFASLAFMPWSITWNTCLGFALMAYKDVWLGWSFGRFGWFFGFAAFLLFRLFRNDVDFRNMYLACFATGCETPTPSGSRVADVLAF